MLSRKCWRESLKTANIMKEEILKQLEEIESTENIKILYACESGSRAWGFPSKDSDYDVRFIYVRDRDWYLRIDYEKQRDVVERPINDLLDINGWDLKKALKLLAKSNPTLIEWFNSPIVYRCDEKFTSKIKELIAEYYSPRSCFYHYEHMAKNNNRGYLQGEQVRIKKYFYALRPVLAMMWIEQGKGIIPMEFELLVKELIDDELLLKDIHQLLNDKRVGFEAEYMPRIESMSRFINEQLERLADIAKSIKKIELNYDSLNQLFLDTILSKHQ